MNARERIEAALALCTKAGVEPKALSAGSTSFDGSQLTLSSCADYRAVAKAAKVKEVDGGRLLGDTRGANPHQIFDMTIGDDLVVVHTCWPHLDCWGS